MKTITTIVGEALRKREKVAGGGPLRVFWVAAIYFFSLLWMNEYYTGDHFVIYFKPSTPIL